MTAQITIIGLGQVGASIGMALGENKATARRVGFDRDPAVANAALTLGVVDEIKRLPDATQNADIVLLCLPLAEMRETLKKIGPVLKAGAVVMDTAPIKSQMTEWVQEFIPQGRFYLGLVPSLTAEALSAPESGLNAARPDLFKKTVMVVDVPPGTPEEVEKLGFGFARMLGAKPMLANLAESDSLMAAIHLLPQLASVALIHATIDQPGWAESRKLTGGAFAAVTRGAADFDDAASLKTASLVNRDSVLRSLDLMLASLTALRDEIAEDEEQNLTERFDQAFEARQRWLDERTVAPWLQEGGEGYDITDFGEQVMNMLFGSSIVNRMKKKK